MKPWIVALCCALLFLTGCGSTYYTVKTKDGTSYVSVGEPDYSRSTESYEFEDLDGKNWRINREEVLYIEEKLH